MATQTSKPVLTTLESDAHAIKEVGVTDTPDGPPLPEYEALLIVSLS